MKAAIAGASFSPIMQTLDQFEIETTAIVSRRSSTKKPSSFSSDKFNFINAALYHPMLKDKHFRFLVAIVQRVDEKKGAATITDRALEDMLPGFHRTKLFECRRDLCRWKIISCQTSGLGRPNVYRLLDGGWVQQQFDRQREPGLQSGSYRALQKTSLSSRHLSLRA